MAKSLAERQAAYRARRKGDHSVRLNLYLTEDAGRQLKRLAHQRGQSRAAVLADLIRAADESAQDALADEAAIAAYFYGPLRRNGQ